MWTWEYERRRPAAEPQAQLGRVSIGGVLAAAALGGERRWLPVCAPGGMNWAPAADQQVLVLKTGEDSPPCVLGVVQEEELLPGQVKLSGGGCTLLLGEEVEVTGGVKINGESLEELVRRVVQEVTANG